MRPRFTSHDGFLMPMGFPVEHFDSALRYTPRPEDIFISTYPKCGTTWTQNIVYLILHGGEPLPPDKTMTHEIPHLEEMGREFVEALEEPRCVKTHLPLRLTPWNEETKYLYVARNPFDCAVSFYHHTRGFVQHYDFEHGSFDDYFECFVTGEIDFGDYFDNLIPWAEKMDEPNVLLLTYEDMKDDPRAAIAEIGSFLGGIAAGAVADASVLDRIVEHSSFDAMKKDQLRWASKRPADMPAFIRKGKVGDWQNHFSPEQAHRLAERFDEKTLGTRVEGLWSDILKAARSSR